MTQPLNPKPAPHQLEVAPYYLFILAGPIGVYLLLEFILKGFGDVSVVIPVTEFAEPARILELVGRYKFLAAFAVFASVSTAIIAIFLIDLMTNFTRRTVIFAGIAIVLSAAFGLVMSVFEPAALEDFQTYFLLGRRFFESALSVGASGQCADVIGPCDDRTALRLYLKLSDPINTLTSFGAATALTGMVLSLATPLKSRAAPTDLAARARDLQAARVISQRYLYCAGVLLTTGMAFVLSWMHWPTALIAEEGLRALHNDLIGSITLYIGVGYSVMILSAYLPVMLIQTRRTEVLRIAIESGTFVDPPELPEVDYINALKAILAIVSPILASAVGSLGQTFMFS